MYSIVQAYHQWKHYILGKEIIIHTDHKPLQFIQAHGKLQNNCHQKWSTYLQQFHLNIKYNTRSTNHVDDYLSRPPVTTLTTMLHSCGHEASEWPQNLSTKYKLHHHLSTLGYMSECHRFSHWPSLCSYKRACKVDLGGSL
jgi:hypothetical protein